MPRRASRAAASTARGASSRANSPLARVPSSTTARGSSSAAAATAPGAGNRASGSAANRNTREEQTAQEDNDEQAPEYVMNWCSNMAKLLPKIENRQGTIKLLTPLSRDIFPDFILYPPNPTIHHPEGKDTPEADDFYMWRRPVIIWAPECFWPEHVSGKLICPNCHRSGVVRSKGFAKPRKVFSLQTSYWLYARRYVCDSAKISTTAIGQKYKGCGTSFAATNQAVLDQLPQFIRCQFRFSLSKKKATTGEVDELCKRQAINGQGFQELSQFLNDLHNFEWSNTLQTYYNYCIDRHISLQGGSQQQEPPVLAVGVHGANAFPQPQELKPFSKRLDSQGYCDTTVTADYLRLVYRNCWENGFGDYVGRLLSMPVSEYLCLDYAHYAAEHVIERDGNSPYKSLLTVMDAVTGVVVIQMWTRTRSLEEAEPAFRQLRERMRRNNQNIRVVWTPNCCSDRPHLTRFLGQEVQVVGDMFKLQKTIAEAMSRNHPLYGVFMRELSSAIMVISEMDKAEAIRKAVVESRMTVAAAANMPPSWFKKRCRYYIPAPQELVARLEMLVETFTGQTGTSSEPLLKERTMKELRNLIVHAEKGCLSDPLPIDQMYTVREGDRLLVTIRGTNKVQSFHQVLRSKLFSGTVLGVDLGNIMTLHLNADHNRKCLVKLQKEEDYGVFDQRHLVQVKERMKAVCAVDILPSLVIPPETEERFGMDGIISNFVLDATLRDDTEDSHGREPSDKEDEEEEEEDNDFSAHIDASSARDEEDAEGLRDEEMQVTETASHDGHQSNNDLNDSAGSTPEIEERDELPTPEAEMTRQTGLEEAHEAEKDSAVLPEEESAAPLRPQKKRRRPGNETMTATSQPAPRLTPAVGQKRKESSTPSSSAPVAKKVAKAVLSARTIRPVTTPAEKLLFSQLLPECGGDFTKMARMWNEKILQKAKNIFPKDATQLKGYQQQLKKESRSQSAKSSVPTASTNYPRIAPAWTTIPSPILFPTPSGGVTNALRGSTTTTGSGGSEQTGVVAPRLVMMLAPGLADTSARAAAAVTGGNYSPAKSAPVSRKKTLVKTSPPPAAKTTTHKPPASSSKYKKPAKPRSIAPALLPRSPPIAAPVMVRIAPGGSSASPFPPLPAPSTSATDASGSKGANPTSASAAPRLMPKPQIQWQVPISTNLLNQWQAPFVGIAPRRTQSQRAKKPAPQR